MNKSLIVICDIDGTIADCKHRLGFIDFDADPRNAEAGIKENFIPNWDAFYKECVKDQPIPQVVEMLQSLKNTTQIIFITGRSESVRFETYEWLKKHCGQSFANCAMYMRNIGDERSGSEIKKEIFEREIKKKKDSVLFVLDDEPDCVDMWRSLGLNCIKVENGVIK